ncbi:secE (nucleomorph) [Hemiselmis andersenii]|uniref:SecE n=1 Tax=Hemiselmis andersenii TaxID=464988 RepID=A9BKJ4_HEMAN|nr:secE [Hemiselmis andersenii]ABW98165.1 secE [Hemiselmis andersenii]
MIAFVTNANYSKVKKFQKKISNVKEINNPNFVLFSTKTKKIFKIKMQKEEENFSENKPNILDFFQEVKDEIKMIEWPTFDRVLKQFVIVLISLVFSALFIFSIDGLFAAGNKILFEGNF